MAGSQSGAGVDSVKYAMTSIGIKQYRPSYVLSRIWQEPNKDISEVSQIVWPKSIDHEVSTVRTSTI